MSDAQATNGTDRRVSGRTRGRAVTILVDGRPVAACEGESVAAVLFAAGRRCLGTAPRTGAPRGVYCGIGLCFECAMTVDGRPGMRTCRTLVREGMRVDTPARKGGGP